MLADQISKATVPQAFRVVLSRIFFNTAVRSPKVGKNVDKSLLIIAVGLKCSQSQTTFVIWCCLLPQFVVVGWFVVPNVFKQVFVHYFVLNV